MIRFLVFALIAASDAASSALKEGAQCNLSDGQGRGICKTFNQCSWAEEQVKVGGSPSVCFFTKNDQPVVCCPDNTSGYATTTTSTDVLVSSAERITIPPSSIAQGGVVSENIIYKWPFFFHTLSRNVSFFQIISGKSPISDIRGEFPRGVNDL
ncbi:uncharacterized protein LOC117642362 [Thrips palmi]|uniref:Uncharacterized protein LOC117642362 n=1 Tax=Thrips palmi TaxID=161013 RepID=A0A6P8ZK20_THRPL|nr:uncharacterized protein LOC117642362 [Thrips palmi]